MNPLLEKLYRAEYSSTPISMEAIRKKYNIPEDFDTSSWEKDKPVNTEEPENTVTAEVMDDSDPTPHNITSIPNNPPATQSTDPDTVVILEKVVKAKHNILEIADEMLTIDRDTIGTKELKDLMSIVDTMEKSVKPQQQEAPKVSFVFAEVVSRYKDDV